MGLDAALSGQRQVLDISEIRFIPSNKPLNGFLGFASFVLNGMFFVGNIGVYSKFDGSIRLVYPVKSNRFNGKEYPLFYPISRDIGDLVTDKIQKFYDENIGNYQSQHG